jgi:hypothetical protein
MTNALKVLLQMQSGFLQLESTIGTSSSVFDILKICRAGSAARLLIYLNIVYKYRENLERGYTLRGKREMKSQSFDPIWWSSLMKQKCCRKLGQLCYLRKL